MKTRSNMPLFVVACTNIKQLTNEQINMLRCGDWVVKKTGNQEHAYKVTFKSPTGICLTYMDASVIETQSYDLVDGNWVYNSQDKTPVAEPLLENVVDSKGRNRFIEGDVNMPVEITGVTKIYGKWSLSGTHLMVVMVLNLEDTTVVPTSSVVGLTDGLPKWIYDKIVPTISTSGVEIKSFTAFDSSSQSQTFGSVLLNKANDNQLSITKYGALTLTSDKKVKIIYDLVIDND